MASSLRVSVNWGRELLAADEIAPDCQHTNTRPHKSESVRWDLRADALGNRTHKGSFLFGEQKFASFCKKFPAATHACKHIQVKCKSHHLKCQEAFFYIDPSTCIIQIAFCSISFSLLAHKFSAACLLRIQVQVLNQIKMALAAQEMATPN
jgi:hypothetical protein